jgi:hypothetical protein
MLGRDVEFLAAGFARHGIVDANHVVAQLGKQGTIALVGAWRDPIFLRPNDPAHLVLIYTLAPRTGQLVGAGFIPVIEEIAFVKGHHCILLPGLVKKPSGSADVQNATSRAALVVAFLATLAALGAQNSETGSITGEVKLKPNAGGMAIPSTAYPTRAIGPRTNHPIPETTNVVVYLKALRFAARWQPPRPRFARNTRPSCRTCSP